MGWLDFLKKKEIKAVEVKEVNSSQALELAEQKQKNNNLKIDEIKKIIDNSINDFTKNIEIKIELLNKIDLSDKKDHQKVKLITLENLKVYTSHLVRFKSSIKKTIDPNLEKYLINIGNILDKFKKDSFRSFERSTLLIGKEMEETKEEVIKFSRLIDRIAHDSKDHIEKNKLLENLEKIKISILENKKIIKEIEDNIEKFRNKFDNLSVNLDKEKIDLTNFKNTEEYTRYIDSQEEKRKEKEKLLLLTSQIKEKVNLKELANRFHTIEKKKELLQNYRSNFIDSLVKDTSNELSDMLKSTNLNLSIEIKKIREEHLKLQENIKSDTKIKIENYDSKIKKFEFELTEINKNIKNEEQKIQKFIIKNDENKKSLIKQSINILDNVKLID